MYRETMSTSLLFLLSVGLLVVRSTCNTSAPPVPLPPPVRCTCMTREETIGIVQAALANHTRSLESQIANSKSYLQTEMTRIGESIVSRLAECVPRCVHGQCTGTNQCTCLSRWTGSLCNQPICSSPCVHGRCTNPNQCTCHHGWRGRVCNEAICSPPCSVHGHCTGPNRCSCFQGWGGSVCNEAICSPSCRNGGTCSSPGVCSCTPGYAGDTCETSLCSPPCRNGGTCTSSGVCTCRTAYYGNSCQTFNARYGRG